jgi:tight adherence protein B
MNVTAIMHIAVQTGGPLGPSFEAAAELLRTEQAIHRELWALTAQARASGMVLAVVPIGFCVLVSASSIATREFLLTDRLGHAMLLLGLGMNAAGWLWIRRLAQPASRVAREHTQR